MAWGSIEAGDRMNPTTPSLRVPMAQVGDTYQLTSAASYQGPERANSGPEIASRRGHPLDASHVR
ncbi:Uu.00g049790.m01.CDS01 [Anthostomella pinea]|uniref:Uu.00g049790.m01.CDS01 n=1 Tax=Anthostomella pinea TaxID=933095 RepID=A0AAI8YEQ9_9PEZI|nr:Uu.00g049790.m01.CDS01 [Anthostomella pinea]